jgi:hypothetical protein
MHVYAKVEIFGILGVPVDNVQHILTVCNFLTLPGAEGVDKKQ